MYFHKFILILFLIVHQSWCNDDKKPESKKNVSESTTKPVENDKTSATVVPLPDICDKCNCTEDSIKCTTWDLKKANKDYKWQNKTWKVVSFENTPLTHLTQFPAIPITKIVFSGNKIREIDNKIFINIINLEEVAFSNNELVSTILHPNIFEGKFAMESYEPLKNLKVLNLSYNLLHTLNQGIFEHTREIRVLSLRGNPLVVIDAPTAIALSDIPFLEVLDLSYCGLSTLPHEILHSSHMNLYKLDLSGNKITTPPVALQYAKSLKVLTMDNNPINFIAQYNAFPELPSLLELNLRNMSQLVLIEEGTFSKLSNLATLRIQNCPRLFKISEKAFISTSSFNNSESFMWPPLKRLLISNNALRYLPERLVARWDRLEKLDLMNNQWSCDCDNQYLIGSLISELGRKFMGERIEELKCAYPPEHVGKSLASFGKRKLRCLDLYEARPERDAAILVGVLIGILLMIPIVLTFFFLWKRGFFFCGSHGPASFSRAFYRRTPGDEI